MNDKVLYLLFSLASTRFFLLFFFVQCRASLVSTPPIQTVLYYQNPPKFQPNLRHHLSFFLCHWPLSISLCFSKDPLVPRPSPIRQANRVQ
ncbi:hypothetical protein LI328DRAFT_134143 [Trichoderma asperelloides]|nr:hypothetical protein LI328DRAFT_134143 [Trichoderma asperelloides]